MTAYLVAACEQLLMNSRRSVVGKLSVDFRDLDCELHVLRSALARWSGEPFEPVVVARSRDSQDLAQHADLQLWIGSLLRADVAVDLYWSTRRAKKASAFPKISTS